MFKILEFIPKAIAWLQIALSPTLIGGIAGFIIYKYRDDIYGAVIGIVLASLGIIIGVVWATRVWKKRGTVELMSRIMATPELDKKEEDEK
jgi:hypothetical protein